MSRCRNLETYLDGRLQGDARQEFEAHLAGCAPCRASLDEWRQIESASQELLDAFVRDATDACAASRLISRAQDGAPRRAWIRVAVFAGATAAVVAAISILVLTTSIDEGEPPRPTATSAQQLDYRVLWAEDCGFPEGAPIAGRVARVPGKGRLVIELGADRVGLGAGSVAEIQRADEEQTLIELERGTIAAAVDPRPRDSVFAITAGEHRVVVRGTRFSVALEADGSLAVAVSEGVVLVTGLAGLRREVQSEWLLAVGPEGGRLSPLGTEERRALDDLLTPHAEEPSKRQNAAPDATHPIEEASLEDAAGSAAPASPKVAPKPDAGARPTAADDLDTWRAWVIEGRYGEAEQALVRYLESTPADSEAWLLLANCRRKAGRLGAAMEAYQEVIDRGGERAARARYLAASMAQDQLSDHVQAAQLLQAFLAEVGGSSHSLAAEARLRLARAWLSLGRRADAERLLGEIMVQNQGTSAAAKAGRLLADSPAKK